MKRLMTIVTILLPLAGLAAHADTNISFRFGSLSSEAAAVAADAEYVRASHSLEQGEKRLIARAGDLAYQIDANVSIPQGALGKQSRSSFAGTGTLRRLAEPNDSLVQAQEEEEEEAAGEEEEAEDGEEEEDDEDDEEEEDAGWDRIWDAPKLG